MFYKSSSVSHLDSPYSPLSFVTSSNALVGKAVVSICGTDPFSSAIKLATNRKERSNAWHEPTLRPRIILASASYHE